MRAPLAAIALLLTLQAPGLADETAPAGETVVSLAPHAESSPPADPVRSGQVFLEANCSGCHAISLSDTGLNADAPPFREIVTRYPPEDLAEAFGEGIWTGHPDMPEFELAPRQIDGLIAYLNTLVPPS
ncbi:c-type cytochrome [Segnochrobactraceae bacterium EtOH-i3]